MYKFINYLYKYIISSYEWDAFSELFFVRNEL